MQLSDNTKTITGKNRQEICNNYHKSLQIILLFKRHAYSCYSNNNYRTLAVQSIQLPSGLHIRPSTASDKAFLEKLHHATRQDLQVIDGEKDLIETLVEMQLKAQTQGYGDQFPNAMYFIIEKQQQPVGKATIDFSDNLVHLIDIALIPQARGQGFGKAILQSFQRCAAQIAAPMLLSVELHNNIAKQLYQSLGFTTESVQPPYERMIWYPPALRSFSMNMA